MSSRAFLHATAGAAVPAFAGVLVLSALLFGAGALPSLSPKAQKLGKLAIPAVFLGGAYLWSRRNTTTTAHGSARWGNPSRLRRPVGLLLGAERGDILRAPALEGHLLTVAPTGAGKGIGAVLPNLLDYPGSVLVNDPKGENALVAGAWRARELGQRVEILDPFGLAGGAAAWNPLDLLEPESPDLASDAMMLAGLLVQRPAQQGDGAYWDDEAQALLQTLILLVATSEPDERRNLGRVRELLTQPAEKFDLMLQEMLESPAAAGLLARGAARILQKQERERSSVVSTAQRHTHFLDSPRIAAVLERSTFQPIELRTDRLSVFLCLPPAQLSEFSRWLRLVIGGTLRALSRTPHSTAEPALILLDECASLGALEAVSSGISLLRGYGVRLWTFWQDLAQLRATYSHGWETILANSRFLQAYGTADEFTADYLSKLTGMATVRSTSTSQTAGSTAAAAFAGGSSSTSTATSSPEVARRLLTADEIRRLPPTKALVFEQGRDPLRVERLSYLTNPTLRARAGAHPAHGG